MEKLIKIFKKYKLLIYLIVFITTLLVFILNFFFLPKIYIENATISPPIVFDINTKYNKYLYDFDSFYAKISDDSFLLNLLKKYPELDLSLDELKNNLKLESTGRTSFIKISFENKDKNKIKKLFGIILDELKINDENYNNYIKYCQEKLKETDDDIKKIEEYKKLIEEKIILIKDKNIESNVEYSFLLSTLNTTNDLLSQKKEEKSLFEMALNLSESYKYLSEPQIEDKPIKPKVLLNTVFAFISSFIISILALYIIDYVRGGLNV